MIDKGKKESARILRLRGWSYEEIHKHLKVAKSTCSLWCRNLKLNKRALKRLRALSDLGRKKGQATNHLRAIKRDQKIDEAVRSRLTSLKLDAILKKLLCSMLYWGEGSKGQNRIVFTNSDPEMIKIFLKLLRESYPLNEKRFQASLHLHSYHNEKSLIEFWTKCTRIAKDKISIYNKLNSGINKKIGYLGCISIRYNDVNISRDLEAYYKNFIKLYGGLV